MERSKKLWTAISLSILGAVGGGKLITKQDKPGETQGGQATHEPFNGDGSSVAEDEKKESLTIHPVETKKVPSVPDKDKPTWGKSVEDVLGVGLTHFPDARIKMYGSLADIPSDVGVPIRYEIRLNNESGHHYDLELSGSSQLTLKNVLMQFFTQDDDGMVTFYRGDIGLGTELSRLDQIILDQEKRQGRIMTLENKHLDSGNQTVADPGGFASALEELGIKKKTEGVVTGSEDHP